jgi:ABC-type transport system involved in multi-copper enzyme maturation permease subunit
MLRILVEKEIKNNLLSLRFMFALLVVLVIVLGSLYVRIDDYLQSSLDYQANTAADRENLDSRWWWDFQWDGKFVERPIQALGVLVSGAERNADRRFKVFEKARPLIRTVGSIDRNPLLALSSPVDIMFITGVVMSLLVLVLSFDAISGEREQGTLKLLLSFPVPRSLVLFGKWVGGVLTLSIPFVLSYLCVAIWILLSPKIQFSLQDWVGFFLIGLASLLYIAWVFSAALLVSCWFRDSASSMCMLLFIWVLVVLVVPNVSPYVAAAIVPVDSVQSVQYKGLKATKEIQAKEDEGLRAIEKKYNIPRWWRHDKGWPEGAKLVSESHDKQRQATRAIVDGREAKIWKQATLAQNIGRISPFTSYAQIVTALAWTSPEFDRHVRPALRAYEDQLRRVTTEGMLEDAPFEPERIPFFRYTPTSLGRRFTMAVMDWVLLIAGTVVFFLGAYVSFVTREVI